MISLGDGSQEALNPEPLTSLGAGSQEALNPEPMISLGDGSCSVTLFGSPTFNSHQCQSGVGLCYNLATNVRFALYLYPRQMSAVYPV